MEKKEKKVLAGVVSRDLFVSVAAEQPWNIHPGVPVGSKVCKSQSKKWSDVI